MEALQKCPHIRCASKMFHRLMYTIAMVAVVGTIIMMSTRSGNVPQISSYLGGKYHTTSIPMNITILVVVTPNTKIERYQRALDSLACYSKVQGYKFVLVVDSDYADVCQHKDKFFRRHCVVAQFLDSCDYLLFLDADIGVVNPKRRIEEFIDKRFDVTFYDRFFNAEIVAGAYLLKNSVIAKEFITGYANFETQLPNSFHGTDNGGLHAYVASKLFPDRKEEYQICLDAWNVSHNYGDLFVFETCIRSMMGITEHFGHYRFLRKGTGWARDNWLTNSKWSPDIDFMIHAWKMPELRQYKQSDLPIRYTWYDPIVGPFNLDQCVPGNVSWNFDPNLIGNALSLKEFMAKYRRKVQRENYQYLAKLIDKVH